MTRVGGDLVTGNDELFSNQITKLHKMHCYGQWYTNENGFHHCVRFVRLTGNGKERMATCAQKG